jgi:hypothetical protein
MRMFLLEHGNSFLESTHCSGTLADSCTSCRLKFQRAGIDDVLCCQRFGSRPPQRSTNRKASS